MGSGSGGRVLEVGETAWTKDSGHGEMIRNGVDQTLTINSCHLRYVYQGTYTPARTLPTTSCPGGSAC